eukprot:365004-Chlamydomonas_euryale.AAC.3
MPDAAGRTQEGGSGRGSAAERVVHTVWAAVWGMWGVEDTRCGGLSSGGRQRQCQHSRARSAHSGGGGVGHVGCGGCRMRRAELRRAAAAVAARQSA